MKTLTKIIYAVTLGICSLTAYAGGWHRATLLDSLHGTQGEVTWVESSGVVPLDVYTRGTWGLALLLRLDTNGFSQGLLRVKNAEFQCDGRCWVYLRFDDGSVQQYAAEKPFNGHTDTLLLSFDDYSRLVDSLKGAKHLVIQVRLLHEGLQQFRFDVSGLEVPYGPATQ